MNIKENIRIAIFSIKTNLMRSLLTMLGIIIGVAAVIAIITLGNGGRDYIVGMIKNMGSSVINISINSKETNASDYITAEDIKAIKNLDSVAYVSQVTMSVGNVTTKHNESLGLAIAGNSDLGNMMSAGMLSGRFFTEEEYESGARVAVLDSISAKLLFGYSDPVGEKLSFTVSDQTVQIKVIGIIDASMLSSSSSNMSETMSSYMSDAQTGCSIIIPATLADALNGNSAGRYEMCYIMAKSDSELDAAGSAAMNLLYTRHGNFGKNAYSLINMATYIDLLDTVINVFTTFIAAVSAISLLVGGIGVMNIMLVSVTERTREIGIRKSLGARTGSILLQFLSESAIITLLGGLIGILIGVTVATQDMMQAIILALASCMILYLPRKKMTFTRYVELFFAGFADILPVLAILLASFMIKTACGEMGLSEYVINLCVPYMNAKTLAAIIFVVIAVLTFVTSSFWGIEAVAVSIVVPLAIALDANVLLALGAVVSGGVFGSHACFYSDATVLSSATCEIDNMSHAVSQFPYVLISAALAVSGFLICGIFAL